MSVRRALHGLLVGAIALAALALVDALGLGRWHQAAGYAALAAVAVRVAWGHAARAKAPVRGVSAPARIAVVAALALSGWLYTTDWFWGSEALENVHLALAWTLLALVLAHVLQVAIARRRRRQRMRQRAPQ